MSKILQDIDQLIEESRLDIGKLTHHYILGKLSRAGSNIATVLGRKELASKLDKNAKSNKFMSTETKLRSNIDSEIHNALKSKNPSEYQSQIKDMYSSKNPGDKVFVEKTIRHQKIIDTIRNKNPKLSDAQVEELANKSKHKNSPYGLSRKDMDNMADMNRKISNNAKFVAGVGLTGGGILAAKNADEDHKKDLVKAVSTGTVIGAGAGVGIASSIHRKNKTIKEP